MKSTLLLLFVFFCLISPNALYAQQKKRKKIKPVYHGKLQGGYLIDKYVPKGYAGFNYFNIGIRKVTGEKIRESGIEIFYYQEVHDRKLINNSYTTGNRQTGFSLNFYHYLMVKQWKFGKFNLQTGPQFSFGYYHIENQPLTSNNFALKINDFKLSVTGVLQLNYKIDERYSCIIGVQYTPFQFGLRRMNNQNPGLDRRSRIEDFIQTDFLVNRYITNIGILRQFGKVRINREKLRKKRERDRKQKQDKITKKRQKKLKKKAKKTKKRQSKKKK